MFIGRIHEISRLIKEFSFTRPSLLVVYGRRRIGKSVLLKEAAKDRPHVLYQATRVTPTLNLDGFKAEIARSLGADPLLDGLGDWLGVLTYLARKAEEMPGLIVVLDEFPYLVEGDPALPSIIQKFWDAVVADEGKLNLVLCGSMIAQMEDLLAERNPLYGRQTLSLEVKALPLRDAARFFPEYPAEDRTLAYAIFGGIPFYLKLCDPSASLKENVTNLLLTDAGTLVDEPNVLLQSELRETQRYASILAAIADGCTKLGEIGGRVRDIKDSVSLSPYMRRLERMRLVRTVHSLDASPKSRDTRYFVDDPLVAFWHRFVRPNMSSVMQGFGHDIWRHQVAPQLDEYMVGAFEEICRGHARRHAQEALPSPAQEIGQIWSADYDIDVAGRLLDGSVLYGECKWRRGVIGADVLGTLIERAGRTEYGRGIEDRHFILYARTGFKAGVHERAKEDGRVVLMTPNAMLAL
ncbi:ATP-binding protein [Mesorhizobium sp. VK24D]|uniref:ATP-binding protein n=1 Tax=Mesorhizobium album TaxID=3072314 RepID=A0ABU4Y6F4_9HYPH|nr:ATP-binding protein [Mesorhizobium sp. VK24D]MDX8482515.1 ATP-binding protein [Mesorhizobium sp. VK24D]